MEEFIQKIRALETLFADLYAQLSVLEQAVAELKTQTPPSQY